MVAACVLLFYYLGGTDTIKQISVVVLVYCLAFLMVSNVKYYSFKDPELVKRQPFGFLVLAIFMIVVIVARPEIMLFVLALTYVASGPIGALIGLLRNKKAPLEGTSE
jgi:CDP-diacylglycerol--serine O-phosphatidyltransferase